MPKGLITFTLAVTLGAAGISMAGAASAAVPERITQQGRLFSADGEPVNDTLDVEFAIYDGPDASVPIWSEVHTIAFDDGFFSIALGGIVPFDPATFDGSVRHIGIRVGNDPEMEPRAVVGSVPYALLASNVNGDITPSSVSIQGAGEVIDANGNWVGDPAGLAGPAGPAGPPGIAGATGSQGMMGPIGPTGAMGPIGPTGAMGPIGPMGEMGPIGPMGEMGPIGPTGAAGPMGPQGLVGPTGPIGPAGPAGSFVAPAPTWAIFGSSTFTHYTGSSFVVESTSATNLQVRMTAGAIWSVYSITYPSSCVQPSPMTSVYRSATVVGDTLSAAFCSSGSPMYVTIWRENTPNATMLTCWRHSSNANVCQRIL